VEWPCGKMTIVAVAVEASVGALVLVAATVGNAAAVLVSWRAMDSIAWVTAALMVAWADCASWVGVACGAIKLQAESRITAARAVESTFILFGFI